jgi:hypothetical protein
MGKDRCQEKTAMIKWQDILRHAVRKDTIRAASLRKIPHLKDCPFWDQAEFLGTVFHRIKYATYDGGLVKYDGRIYYVSKAQIRALRKYLRWNLKKQIVVTES